MVDMFVAITGVPFQTLPHLKVVETSKLTSFLDFTSESLGTIRTSE
jgi:hypothetical protein